MPIRKLIYGSADTEESTRENTFAHRIHNIKAIWNNEQHLDIGLERIVRLLLAVSQLFFLGTYIRQFIAGKRVVQRDITMDAFVVLKTLFPVFILYFGLQTNPVFIAILIWLMLETLSYIPTLIFASDIFPKPRSYGRSIILLLMNYLEIVFGFAVLYSTGNYLNQAFTHWFDPIYFSFVTSGAIGYGEIYPVTTIGKVLVSFESVIFLIMIVLFLNFFTRKIVSKGYFQND